MIKTLWQRFKQYYQERGKYEFHSYFKSFVTGFFLTWGILGYEAFGLIQEATLSWAFLGGLANMIFRSILGGLLFVLKPNFFPSKPPTEVQK